jgi:hypothetical protein
MAFGHLRVMKVWRAGLCWPAAQHAVCVVSPSKLGVSALGEPESDDWSVSRCTASTKSTPN